MAKRTFAFVAVFAALLSVTLSVQAQDTYDNSTLYWIGGAGDNKFYTGSLDNGQTSNWQDADGTLCPTTYISGAGTAPLWTQNCFVYSASSRIWIDYGSLGVASLTIGDGNGSSQTATMYRDSTLYLWKPLTVQAGGTLEVSGLDITNGGELNLNGGTIKIGSGGFTNAGNPPNYPVTSYDYTINLGGGTLGNYNNNWSSALNANVEGGTVTTFSPDSGKTITWSGAFNQTGTGTATIRKTGAGTLTLSASGSNTINCDLIIDNGIVSLSNSITSNNRFKSGATITVNTGGKLQLNANDSTGYAKVPATFNLYGGELAMNVAKNETLATKTINLKAGTISTLNDAGSMFDIWDAGNVFNVKAETGATPENPTVSKVKGWLRLRNTSNFNITVDPNAKLIIGNEYGGIKQNGTTATSPVVKLGSGVLVYEGTNTYDANTTVSAGELILASGATLTTSGVVTANGGNLTVDGGTLYTSSSSNSVNSGTITVKNNGSLTYAGAGQFRITGSSAALNIEGGTVTVNGISYIGVAANGVINQSGGTANFNNTLAFGWGDSTAGEYNLTGDGILNTTQDAGLWCGSTSTKTTPSIFTVNGGTANFKQEGNSFVIGYYNTPETFSPCNVANVFNLNSGTVNATDTFAIQYGGTLNVAKNGETAGDGVLNAKKIDINNGGNLNMSSGTINLGAGGITSSGNGYSINLSGGTFGTNNASWTTSLAATISSNAVTFAPEAGQMITWSGALDGEGGIIKTGAGDLKITAGDNGQNYTGGTTVSAGTLYLSGTNRGKSSVGEGDLTINSGAAVVAQSHNVFGSNIPNVIINGGSLTPNQYLHMKSLEINSGTVNSHGSSGDGLDFSDRNGTITSTGASSIASAIKNSSTLTINVTNGTLSLTNNINNIENSSNTTIKTGAGLLTTSGWINANVEVQQGTLQITGQYNNKSKRFNGEITIAKGALLDCATKDSLGYGSANTKINIYGTMDSSVDNETLNNTELHMYGGTAKATSGSTFDILNTGVKFYSYALTGATAETPTVSTISPTLFLRHNGTLSIDTAANSRLELTGEITGHYKNGDNTYTDFTCSINKSGDGTLEITANNPNYFGTTTISAGTLVLSGDGTLGTGEVANSATLEFAHTADLTGDNAFANVISGTGAVNKTGSGTLTLSGANTYTGMTTVSAGVLELTGDAIVANGQVYVDTNGTLKYSWNGSGDKTLTIDAVAKKIYGTGKVIVNADEEAVLKIYTSAKGMIDVQSLTISSGRVDIKDYFDGQLIVQGQGTFSPGNSVGTLIIGDGTYGNGGFILNEAGAELLMEIGGATPDLNDGLIVAGPITLADDSIITLVNNSNLGLGESFTAILSAENSANLDVLGHIQTTDFTELKYVQINDATHGTVYAITGRTLNANEIPEPSTWALLILGAAGMLYWRKRKNNK